MQFLSSRRAVRISLSLVVLAAFVAATYAAIRHGRGAVPAPSEKILITPGDVGEAAAAPSLSLASTATPQATLDTVSEAESEPQTFSLDRLRCKAVTVTQYKLDAKDNYWTVADKHGINLPTLLGANPTMPFKAHIGLMLNLLSQRGVLHLVYPGETIDEIADLYHVDPASLAKENGLHWWHGARAGDVLFIPDVKPVRMLKEWRDYFSQRGFFGVPFAHWGEAITSGFGWRHDPLTGQKEIHPGMDFRAKVGESVYASASGRVIFAGVAGGYGNLIKIHHNSVYTTYYGHLSQILVKAGQKVKRGQLIGKTGATGHVTGPHLHFEIRKNGRPINPLPLI